METLTFEIVDFPDTYHAILGQPCYANFMAIPNYTYLKLKIPGPKGVITVEGSFKQAYYHEQECVTQAAALVVPYAPNGLGHDAEGASTEETTKAAAVLDRSSIGKADKVPSGSGGLASPSI